MKIAIVYLKYVDIMDANKFGAEVDLYAMLANLDSVYHQLTEFINTSKLLYKVTKMANQIGQHLKSYANPLQYFLSFLH